MTLKNCKVTFQPTNKELEIPVGTPLKEAMDLAGLDFDFPCGGRGKCGKCRVRVIEGLDNIMSLSRLLRKQRISSGLFCCSSRGYDCRTSSQRDKGA